jgi:hypothetical protein
MQVPQVRCIVCHGVEATWHAIILSKITKILLVGIAEMKEIGSCFSGSDCSFVDSADCRIVVIENVDNADSSFLGIVLLHQHIWMCDIAS